MVPAAIVIGLYSYLFFLTVTFDSNFYKFSYLVYGDFTATTAIIENFHHNALTWPLQYPLFCGKQITYHFGFMALVGLVEKLIPNLSIALNLVSITALVFLVIFTYLVSLKLFKDKTVAALSPFVYLFNPSLEWVYLIKRIAHEGLGETLKASNFFAAGPYRPSDVVSIFWNLNTFVNQRHLILGFALVLALIYLDLTEQGRVEQSRVERFLPLKILGVVLLTIINKAALLIYLLYLGMIFILANKYLAKILTCFFLKLIRRKCKLDKNQISQITTEVKRSLLALGFITAVTLLVLQIFYGQFSRDLPNAKIHYKPGFLVNSVQYEHSYPAFTKWFLYIAENFTLLPIAAVGGFILAYKSNKQNRLSHIALIATALGSLFTAFTVTFSSDPAVNHKLVNFFIYISAIYAIYFIVKLKNIPLKALIFSWFILTLSLNLTADVVPYLNSDYAQFLRPERSKVSRWILQHTNPTDCFLNLTYETMPITLTGRYVFFGWDYYPMSAGYNTLARREQIKFALARLYRYNSKEKLCELMKKNNLKYIFLHLNNRPEKFADIQIFSEKFKNFPAEFKDSKNMIISYQKLCYDH